MTSSPGIGGSASPGISGGSAAPWYRVIAVPDTVYGGNPDRDFASVLPAALKAAQLRRPFVAGWLSSGGGAPLELITNSGPMPAVPGDRQSGLRTAGIGRRRKDTHRDPAEAARAPGSAAAGAAGPGGRCELLFPWGARGEPFGANLMAELDAMVWAPCPGRPGPPAGGMDAGAGMAGTGWAGQGWSGQGSGAGQAGGSWLASPGGGFGANQPSLFEAALTTLMARPFGWLIVAEPTDLIDMEIADLRTQLSILRRYDEENARFDADRAARRLAELDAFGQAGLWHVRVLVGAADAEQIDLIAPMLIGSVDLAGHPYRLRGPERARDLADALAATTSNPADGSAVPFAATAGVLSALTGLPRREVPGVRMLDVGYFDVTAESSGEPEIGIGTILDGQDRAVGELGVPLQTLNRHALVTGATGSGKSQTIRHLLVQLTRAEIPWLVVEPVKSEYAAMAGRLAAAGLAGAGGGLTLINPADPGTVPLSVNPLAPEPGYPVQAHIDMVRALFLAAFEAHEPFPQIMSQALQRVYQDCGWDPVTGAAPPGAVAPPAIPTLEELRAAALDVIDEVGYGRELQADVRGFVDVRLRSLRTGSAGRFFEGGHPADITELLRRNVVLAIEDITNDEDKAFLIGTLIIRIVEHLRLRARATPADGLRHVFVIEEAHRLLRADRTGAAGHAVELFAGLLAEIRAYGAGLVIAEQIPAKLVQDVVKNTALKIVHRLPAHDDREVVGATMNLDAEQSRQVVSFPPGIAAVFADGMDRPVRIRIPFGGQHERAPLPGELADPPMLGRRSEACGPTCREGPACTLLQLRSADLLADARDDAWLRVWSETLVLAFLTNYPMPVVPADLRQRWSDQDERPRECRLATAVERAVRARAAAIRPYFDPGDLVRAVAATALRMLSGGKGAATKAAPEWVIPQLRWLREIERACPMVGPEPDPFGPAPRLELELPGLPDPPDMKIGQRISGLRRHAFSMELPRNREPAWLAVLGADDQVGFTSDLATLAVGSSNRGQLLQVAGEMGVAGWLEPVLSWPRRFIVGADDQAAAERAAAAASAGASAAGAAAPPAVAGDSRPRAR